MTYMLPSLVYRLEFIKRIRYLLALASQVLILSCRLGSHFGVWDEGCPLIPLGFWPGCEFQDIFTCIYRNFLLESSSHITWASKGEATHKSITQKEKKKKMERGRLGDESEGQHRPLQSIGK
jgi:hypothetical protein